MSTARPFLPSALGSLALAVAVAQVGLASPARAQGATAEAPPSAPPLPAPYVASPELLQRLDEVEQQARIANRKLELLADEAAVKKLETPTLSADDKGFGITSGDKQYDLRFHGLVQLDARRAMDTTDPAISDRDTFVPRRVRPILDGTVFGLADFRIMPDFGNGVALLMDGYIDVHPKPWLRLRAGKFKPPLGLERLQNDAVLPLIERALDANLTPQRDVGLQLWGDILGGGVRYELAILNGAADGASTDLDINHAKTYAGRVFLRPFQLFGLRGGGDLGVGVSLSTGNDRGTAAGPGLGAFRTAGQNVFFTYLVNAMDPNQTVIALKRHTRVNPQLYYYFGGIGLLAEWVKEYQELGKGTETGAVNNTSGHVTASFALGGDVTYDGVKPKKTADWAKRELGAIEVAARINWFSIDDVAFQGSGLADASKSVTNAAGYTLGLSWWLSRNLRASGNWEWTRFDGGSFTTVGGAKVITDRAKEKVILGRLQVAF